jgi:peptide-methionine (S)-S-oxide reductase
MTLFPHRLLSILSVLFFGLTLVSCDSAGAAHTGTLPEPAVDAAKTQTPQTAVFAGGCFWGVQAVFEHVKGVKSVSAGYAGGARSTAEYEVVSSGSTGHAESVQITFDSSQISYGQLLKVFFSVAHDPTELNRQGPDTGTQYRSAIFFANDEQKRVATDYISQIDKARVFSQPIVTQVVALKGFYPAEDYHQDYALYHPDNPYILMNDLPKVAALKREYPSLYTTYKGS